jgi:hypothetical protein
MKVGDLIRLNGNVLEPDGEVGIILKMNVNMRGEQTMPSGVSVLWLSGAQELIYQDELEVISENR